MSEQLPLPLEIPTNNTKAHSDRDHSPLGGSSAHRWCNCPGSVFYLKDLPPQETSEAALLGTKAHELAEIAVSDYLKHKLEGTDPDVRVSLLAEDDEMANHILAYRDVVWNKALEGSITSKAYGLEEKFTLDEHLEMWGTVDFWAIYIDDHGKRTGVICDFKYGYHTVDVDKNAQLAFYACAMREEFRRMDKDLDRIHAIIYQPRVVNPYKETVFTGKQLDSWKDKFFKAANQIYVEKKAKFKVGDWCRFCPAQAICTTYAKKMSAKSALSILSPAEITLPSPESLPDETLVQVSLHDEQIRSFLDAVDSHLKYKLQSGVKLDGIKLVETKTRRKWQDEEEKIVEEFEKMGFKELSIKKLKGIGVVEKELTKEFGRDEARRVLSNFCTQTKSSLVITSKEDPRPEFTSPIGALKEAESLSTINTEE